MADRPSLVATDVKFSHPGVRVLQGFSLTLEVGAPPLGLIGHSGAGKTTALQVLSGDLAPFSGSVRFNGKPIHKAKFGEKKRNRAAVRRMSQYSLTVTDPRLTVAGILGRALKEARQGGRTHSYTNSDLLAVVGLPAGYESRSMATLSGGEKQRVVLAATIATRPDILLLDEPLTGVDPQARGQIAHTLKALIDDLKVATVIASHDLELVRTICPQVAFLADGTIVDAAPLDELFNRRARPAVAEMADAASLAIQRFR